jgi:Flp pilus assembly protein TadG
MSRTSERDNMKRRSHTIWRALVETLKRLKRDKQGVGAVEFAIIFPLLLALYITAFELTIGFSVYKRATRAAGAVADLASQPQTVNKAYLGSMRDVTAAIFAPYSTTGLKLKISGIEVDANKVAKIKWSWDEGDKRPYAVNSIVNIPDNLKQPGAFLVHSELTKPHTLLMFMSSLSSNLTSITIGRDYYFAKREADAITCSDC